MKPAATGPTTLLKDGATPSQLKMRTRSVLSCAASPAVRWMVSMPMFVPAPVAIAAMQSSAKCQSPATKVEPSASSAPLRVSTTAMCTGRWYPRRSASRPACSANSTGAAANSASSKPTVQAL